MGHRGDNPGGRLAASVATAAACVSFVTSPVIRRILVQRGILDNPNHRSSHSQPIPRGGGWACLAGASAGCLTAWAAGAPLPLRTGVGVLALTLVGSADDARGLDAKTRLAAQALVGGAAGAASGHRLADPLVVAATVNVVNFMDGINGITSLTTAVWGANAAHVGVTRNNAHVAIIGAALGGSALGFLPHNLRERRMFLGDVGSYLIGSAMALTALHPSLTWRERALVLAPLAPYVADTGATLAKRALQGKNVLEAHREHLYQRLANERGLGHVSVSAIYASVAAATALLARPLLKMSK